MRDTYDRFTKGFADGAGFAAGIFTAVIILHTISKYFNL